MSFISFLFGFHLKTPPIWQLLTKVVHIQSNTSSFVMKQTYYEGFIFVPLAALSILISRSQAKKEHSAVVTEDIWNSFVKIHTIKRIKVPTLFLIQSGPYLPLTLNLGLNNLLLTVRPQLIYHSSTVAKSNNSLKVLQMTLTCLCNTNNARSFNHLSSPIFSWRLLFFTLLFTVWVRSTFSWFIYIAHQALNKTCIRI